MIIIQRGDWLANSANLTDWLVWKKNPFSIWLVYCFICNVFTCRTQWQTCRSLAREVITLVAGPWLIKWTKKCNPYSSTTWRNKLNSTDNLWHDECGQGTLLSPSPFWDHRFTFNLVTAMPHSQCCYIFSKLAVVLRTIWLLVWPSHAWHIPSYYK